MYYDCDSPADVLMKEVREKYGLTLHLASLGLLDPSAPAKGSYYHFVFKDLPDSEERCLMTQRYIASDLRITKPFPGTVELIGSYSSIRTFIKRAFDCTV